MISLFWIFALLLAAAAVALLALPLVRRARVAADEGVDALGVLRDQKRELDREVAAGRMTADERELRVGELTRRVVEEGLTAAAPAASEALVAPRRSLAVVVAVVVPVLAFGGYWLVGTPAALDPSARALVTKGSGHGDITPGQFREMLAELKVRLEKNPSDATGWKMLAGGLRYIQDFSGAADAYRHLAELAPGDAMVFADYADALAMAQGRSLAGKPEELVRKALELDPRLPKALALAGTIELEKGNKAGARGYYERLLATVPAGSEQANEVRSIIAEIDGVPPPAPMLAQAPNVAAPAAPPPAPSANKAAPSANQAGPSANQAASSAGSPAAVDPAKAVKGSVTLGPAVAAQAKPDDIVYIFARNAQGPRMPLAVLRKKVSELPLQFTLDDSNGMAGGPALSSAGAVKIEARVSKSGDAIPKPGDLRGESAVTAPGASGISIVIDQVVP